MTAADWRRLRRLLGAYWRIANNYRKEVKYGLEKLPWHFLVLVIGHLICQVIDRRLFSPWNAVWGTVWVWFGMWITWRRGGLPFDIALGAHIAGNEEGTRIMRTLIGFFTIETFINICFAIVPVYANIGMALWLPISVMSYFMYRYMGGLTIDWRKWAIVPLVNIIVVALSLYYYSYAKREATLTDPVVWYFIAIGLFLLNMFTPRFHVHAPLIAVGIGVFLELGGMNILWHMRPHEMEATNALLAQNDTRMRKELEELTNGDINPKVGKPLNPSEDKNEDPNNGKSPKEPDTGENTTKQPAYGPTREGNESATEREGEDVRKQQPTDSDLHPDIKRRNEIFRKHRQFEREADVDAEDETTTTKYTASSLRQTLGGVMGVKSVLFSLLVLALFIGSRIRIPKIGGGHGH